MIEPVLVFLFLLDCPHYIHAVLLVSSVKLRTLKMNKYPTNAHTHIQSDMVRRKLLS